MPRPALQLPSARRCLAVQVFGRADKRQASEHAVSTAPVSGGASRSHYPARKDELPRCLGQSPK